MMDHPYLEWTGRLTGVMSLFVMALFFVGGDSLSPEMLTGDTLWLFLFFPLGVAAGFIVGWWKPGLGGGISLASLLLFYGVHLLVDGAFPTGPFFAVLALPGVFLALGRRRPSL